MTVSTSTVPLGDLGETWVQTTLPENPRQEALPVIVLHGGPGMAHDYVRNLAALADDGRTVIHYDQIGCGHSTHLPDAPTDLWTPQLFVDEFINLVEQLDIERYHLVGQSWGGMLGAEIAVTQPAGLASLSICNSPASMPLWVEGAGQLRAQLPTATRKALEQHEADGTIDHPDYLAAVDAFYRLHVCRMDPYPDDFVATIRQTEEDPTVYGTMNGPNEFFVVGSLREWTIIDRLTSITVPTLVLAGEFDEATPSTWAPFAERIADVRSVVIPDTSHCSHLEQPDAFFGAVRPFLAQHDA